MTKTIIRNLILNAIKFSHDNDTIEINVYRKGNEAVCDVIDHGLGNERRCAGSIEGSGSFNYVGRPPGGRLRAGITTLP